MWRHVILGGGTNYALFKDEWKLVEQRSPDQPPQQLLFQIYSDPSEEKDFSTVNPKKFAELLGILRSQPIGQPDRL